jgi:anti-sigma regulatory factor (Ser/Thr protein kinase)
MTLSVHSAHDAPSGAGQHFVQFYDDDRELTEAAASHLAAAVLAGGVAVAIATPSHRQALEAELRAAGVDVPAAVADGTVVLLDAAAMLARFCSDGKIDPEAFVESVGGCMSAAAEKRGPLHAFGEMVALLWGAGDVLGAIELEELWNGLGEAVRFSLMCGYPRSTVSSPEHSQATRRVCQLHSSVVGDPPFPISESIGPPVRSTVQLSAEYPSAPEAPQAARRLVADALELAGHVSATLQQDAELLMSELVTNAVIHAQPPISVAVQCDQSGVRIAVRDRSSALPRPGHRSEMTGLGLGLQIVAAIAGDWGVEPASDGKTVWAKLLGAGSPTAQTPALRLTD